MLMATDQLTPEELGRALSRLAGPPDAAVLESATRQRAKQIRRRRHLGRGIGATVALVLTIGVGIELADRLNGEETVAIEAGSPDPATPLTTQLSEPLVAPAPTVEVLIEAVRNDDLAAISALLDAGADIDQPGDFGFTPLMIASIRGNAESVQLLADRGANPNLFSSSGYTALQLAARSGNADVVLVLAALGVDLETAAETRFGPTALMIAVSHDQRASIDALIDAGADVSAVDQTGRPLVHYALDTLDIRPDDATARALVATISEAGAVITTPDGEVVRLSDLPLDDVMELLINADSPRQS